MKTKIWKKPKLVVLFRGRPEEAVLQVCKSDTAIGPGDSACNTGGGAYNPCDAVTATQIFIAKPCLLILGSPKVDAPNLMVLSGWQI